MCVCVCVRACVCVCVCAFDALREAGGLWGFSAWPGKSVRWKLVTWWPVGSGDREAVW